VVVGVIAANIPANLTFDQNVLIRHLCSERCGRSPARCMDDRALHRFRF
jgi:hypothetical protein